MVSGLRRRCIWYSKKLLLHLWFRLQAMVFITTIHGYDHSSFVSFCSSRLLLDGKIVVVGGKTLWNDCLSSRECMHWHSSYCTGLWYPFDLYPTAKSLLSQMLQIVEVDINGDCLKMTNRFHTKRWSNQTRSARCKKIVPLGKGDRPTETVRQNLLK